MFPSAFTMDGCQPKGDDNMKNESILFENYTGSRTLEEPDLKYLENRLSPSELEELRKQILYLQLEAEEEAFYSALENPLYLLYGSQGA